MHAKHWRTWKWIRDVSTVGKVPVWSYIISQRSFYKMQMAQKSISIIALSQSPLTTTSMSTSLGCMFDHQSLLLTEVGHLTTSVIVWAIIDTCTTVTILQSTYLRIFPLIHCITLNTSCLRTLYYIPDSPLNIIWAMIIVWRIRRKIMKTVLCGNTIVLNHKHTDISSSYRWTVLGFVFLLRSVYLC